MKLRVAVIYGSRTCEHDVSIVSALQAMDNLDKNEYDVVPVYIARDGQWYTGQLLRNIAFYSAFRPQLVNHVAPVMSDDGKLTLMPVSSIAPHGFKGMIKVLMSNMNLGEDTVEKCDVVLPVMHGMNGEDGTLQGLLELFNVPYTSSGVLGSALGMDKIAMKQFFRGCGLPVVDGMWFSRAEWQENREGVLARVEASCRYPMYVKPANLGSSIGISRATDRESLIKAIETAVEYDRRILVERGIEKPVEINCSALRIKGEVRASLCEMPASWEEFLTFDDKYLRGSKSGKGQGMESLARKVPAPISDELTARIRQMTQQVYRAMDCKGVVRIDYMLDGDDLYINEINIIPGSLAFYLWEPLGISFKDMLDCMIEDAFAAHAEKNRSVFSYDSSILRSVQGGLKGAKGGKLGGGKLGGAKLGGSGKLGGRPGV
ncbi:MAG TPA: D-alanine--D-alanine ligase [Candidatus Fimadaptatus faecigallinarum]|uniref:D-alanine--D-alanine ligase n=1 Tax=Candidatus Fimadaptatus faecigallinarum TaxID=2840814 RepID=A0A9D1S4W7_9FIRM|nr:D-alanine--D-alanine ligase [Candidatus Fimadaptatus faecigallinarum]